MGQGLRCQKSSAKSCGCIAVLYICRLQAKGYVCTPWGLQRLGDAEAEQSLGTGHGDGAVGQTGGSQSSSVLRRWRSWARSGVGPNQATA